MGFAFVNAQTIWVHGEGPLPRPAPRVDNSLEVPLASWAGGH